MTGKPSDFRSGFVTFLGRPNVGKSTLMNALVGQKVAITSSKPQTTRRTVRGIINRPGGQIVVVDTPGVHRPRTLLGQRLNDVVDTVLGDVDVIVFCSPAHENIGPGDRRLADSLSGYSHAKKIAVVTKTDLGTRDQLMEHLVEVDALREDWEAVIPLSAQSNEGLDVLTNEFLRLLPPGPALYPDDMSTDEGEQDRIAEIIREACLRDVREELPHSIAVVVQEVITGRTEGVIEMYADIFVERDSQKAIVIGRRGSHLKDIGTRARVDIEELVESKVFLSLHVRVAPGWQSDPKQLTRLGF